MATIKFKIVLTLALVLTSCAIQFQPQVDGAQAQPQGDRVKTADLTYTVDGTSGKAIPQNDTEWTNLLGSAGLMSVGPAAIYSFQDASSPILDIDGNYPMPAVGASHLYQQPQGGWSQLAAQNVYTTQDNVFGRQHLNLPDQSTNSYMSMAWTVLDTPPSTDVGLLSLTDSAFYGGVDQTTLFPACGTTGTKSTGSTPLPMSTVFPIALKHDVTSTVTKFYTPYEIISMPFRSVTSGRSEVTYGAAAASGIHSAAAGYLYASEFIGSGAEMQDDNVGALWTTAGWTVSWYGTPTADVMSGKFFPLAKSQWTALNLPVPAFVWSLQESAGVTFNDYAGDMDHPPLTLGGKNTTDISLGQSTINWSRLAITTTDGSAAQYVGQTTDPHQLPISSTSHALLVLVQVNAAQYGKTPYWSWVAGFGTNQRVAIHVDTAGHFGIDVGASTPTHVTGAFAQTGSTILSLLVYDRTNERIVLYTPGEKITGIYNTMSSSTTPGIYLGSSSLVIPAAGVNLLGAAEWMGSAAEFQDADARALFTGLNFTEAF